MGNMTGAKTTPVHPEKPPFSPRNAVNSPTSFVKDFG